MNRQSALLTASVAIITLVGYAPSAAADATRFLDVSAWQGRFWLRHQEINPYDSRGEIDNRVDGTFLFDEREGRELWLGSGRLTWHVDEWREGCIAQE
jgi:hypothetical protein